MVLPIKKEAEYAAEITEMKEEQRNKQKGAAKPAMNRANAQIRRKMSLKNNNDFACSKCKTRSKNQYIDPSRFIVRTNLSF